MTGCAGWARRTALASDGGGISLLGRAGMAPPDWPCRAGIGERRLARQTGRWSSGWETTARPGAPLVQGHRRAPCRPRPPAGAGPVGWNAPDHESLAGFRSGRRRAEPEGRAGRASPSGGPAASPLLGGGSNAPRLGTSSAGRGRRIGSAGRTPGGAVRPPGALPGTRRGSWPGARGSRRHRGRPVTGHGLAGAIAIPRRGAVLAQQTGTLTPAAQRRPSRQILILAHPLLPRPGQQGKPGPTCTAQHITVVKVSRMAKCPAACRLPLSSRTFPRPR